MSKPMLPTALAFAFAVSLATAQPAWEVRMDHRRGALNDILWTGTQFIAVGNYGGIYTSPDAAAWTVRDSFPNAFFKSITRSPTGRFVAAADDDLALSEDGITWKLKRIYPGIKSTTPLGNRLVGISGIREIYVSSNDTVWEQREEQYFRLPGSHIAWDAASNGKNAVVVGHYDWKKAAVFTTGNGDDWTLRYPEGIAFLDGVAWAKDRYFAFYAGVLASSPDGAEWTRIPMDPTTYLTDVVWTGKRFVAVGAKGKMLVSTDGTRWETVAPKDTLAHWRRVIWAQDRLLLAGVRNLETFIVTVEEAAIGVRPVVGAGPGFDYGLRGGWLEASAPAGDRLVRACLRNTMGLELRSARPDAKGGLRMPLAGLGRGAYVLELEGMKERSSAPVLLAR